MVSERSAEAELRRWRLIARLDDAAAGAHVDWRRAADAMARLIADELGDLVMLAVLADPRDEQTAVSIAHLDPDRERIARAIFDPQMITEIGASAEELVADGRPTVGRTSQSLGAMLAPARQAYDERVGIGDGASAPLISDGAVLGLLACARDRESARYSALDVEAVAAAANKVGWLLQAARLRKAQNDATRQSQRAFDNATIGMATFDPDGRFTSVNPVACTILGRPAEQLIGRLRETFSHPADAGRDRQEMQRMIDGGLGVIRVSRLLRPSGEVRWVRVFKVLVRDTQGRPQSFHAQFADVTDLYESEARAARFEALVHSSPDFIAISDLTGHLEYLNPSGRRMVNLPDDVDITTRLTHEFLPPGTDLSSPASETAGNRRDGQWQGVATLRDWRDDGAIPVLATTFEIRDVHTGEPIARATQRRDIRAEVAAQREVAALSEQRRELLTELVHVEQNERTKLAEDLHDFSIQTLAAAQLRQEFARIQLSRGDVDAATEAIEHVADLVADAIRSLREVLADLQPDEQVAGSFAQGVASVAESLLIGSPLGFDVSGDLADVPPDVGGVLRRSVREALSNALRHARATRVTIVLTDHPTAWIVQVDDDGIGIPAELPERRGHLGLRAMTNRVQAFDGSVTISRRAGGGTSVRFCIPRPQPEAGISGAPAGP